MSVREVSQNYSKQFSAGGVVVHFSKEEVMICLIRRDRYGSPVWCLPKGHIERDEDAVVAALREVYEETGLRCEIIQKLNTIRYQFKVSGRAGYCDKSVTFFLMRAQNTELAPKDLTEVVEARWMDFTEALRLAGYENERVVIRQASDLISRRSHVI